MLALAVVVTITSGIFDQSFEQVAGAISELTGGGASSPGTFNLNSIMSSEAIEQLVQMGDITRFGDLNGDGVVDARDLRYVLQATSGMSLDDLPAPLRTALLASVDTNGDGTIDAADLGPALAAFRSTPAGSAIVDVVGTDPEQLGMVYGQILELGAQVQPTEDGHLDLNDLPPEVRQSLLASLDTNGDGQLSRADVLGLLDSLQPGGSPFDLNHDGKVDEADLQPVIDALDKTAEGREVVDILRDSNGGQIEPRDLIQVYSNLVLLGAQTNPSANHLDLSSLPPTVQSALLGRLDANGDGFLDPADVAPFLAALVEGPRAPRSPPPPWGAASASPPPAGGGLPSGGFPFPFSFVHPGMAAPAPKGGGGGAGAAVGVVLLVALLLVAGYVGLRWWGRRRRPDLQRTVMLTSQGNANFDATSYTAPLPALNGSIAPVASPLTAGAEPISSTKNVDALARARAANTPVPPV